ncbi:MAG: hypothetical protein NUV53_00085 [Patescibacteria group bacterium]|nr:hypothetical protein [Patescibacteria group bacterium]
MYPIPLIQQFRGSAPKLLDLLSERDEEYWIRRGEAEALRLFHEMVRRVPAYRLFLREYGVKNMGFIRSVDDMKEIPIISKDNYLLKYPLEQLCWDGNFKSRQFIISSTSGSTGQPFYFPRSSAQDEQFGLTAELCLRAYFGIDKKTTLFINCFALGVWIGGMFVYQATKHIAERGQYGFSIITPGADKTETLKAVKNLAGKVDQIIIGGYGPLIKDLIDEGIAQGIHWGKYDMKYLFAAEGFTEGFRTYMQTQGGATEIYGGTINIYGTADLGAMAHETPLSIFARRSAVNDSSLYSKLFQYQRIPTFCQYIPELYYFEEIEGRLVCSSPGGIPLVRYDLKDVGQVHKYGEVIKILNGHGIIAEKDMRRAGIMHNIWKLPFVSVFERNDFTVSIYSVNIYPESIRKAFESPKLRDALTGKFTMEVNFDEHHNQFLEIHVELRQDVASSNSLLEEIHASIIEWLSKENSEWKDFYERDDIREKMIPRITFWEYQDPKYFKPGGKQKWVKKEKHSVS